MAGFARLFGSWDEDEYGLGRSTLDAPAISLAPAASLTSPDAFVVPHQGSDSAAPSINTVSAPSEPSPTFGDTIFERPIEVVFFDVDGNGTIDKIAELLDADYIPPILHLI